MITPRLTTAILMGLFAAASLVTAQGTPPQQATPPAQQNPPATPPRPQPPTRDPNTAGFVTAKELTRYFELQWNPLGGVFDAIITNELDERGISKKFTGDWSFTAKGMKSAVKLKGTASNSSDRDEFWQVEVVIPFADLGEQPPKPKDVWRANFYRFNREKDKAAEQLSWSPTRLANFHQPARFGYLEFGDAR